MVVFSLEPAWFFLLSFNYLSHLILRVKILSLHCILWNYCGFTDNKDVLHSILRRVMWCLSHIQFTPSKVMWCLSYIQSTPSRVMWCLSHIQSSPSRVMWCLSYIQSTPSRVMWCLSHIRLLPAESYGV